MVKKTESGIEKREGNPSLRPIIVTFAVMLYVLFIAQEVVFPHVLSPILNALPSSYLGNMTLAYFFLFGLPVAVYIVYKLVTRQSLSAALFIKSLSLKNILYIVIISLAIRSVFVLFELGLPFIFGDGVMQWRPSQTSRLESLIHRSVLVVIFEGFLFRGLLWREFDRTGTGFWKIALVTGITFGIVHNGIFQIGHTTLSGIFFYAPLIYFTRSIWAPILHHVVMNTFPSNPANFVSSQAAYETAVPIFLIVLVVIAAVSIPFAVIFIRKFVAENKHRVAKKAEPQKKDKRFEIAFWALIVLLIVAVPVFRM